jgi:hypothetical protein
MTAQPKIQTDDCDTVVVYDVMRESANQLVAELVSHSTEAGGTQDHQSVLAQIQVVREAVRQVPTCDFDAIAAATPEFRRRLVAAA